MPALQDSHAQTEWRSRSRQRNVLRMHPAPSDRDDSLRLRSQIVLAAFVAAFVLRFGISIWILIPVVCHVV